jgi:signal transduction histidine kinase
MISRIIMLKNTLTSNLAKTLILLFLFILTAFDTYSQTISISQKKALLIYKFAEYTQWPNDNELEHFTIGVITDNENFFSEIKILESTKIKNKEIRILRFKNFKEITKTQILVATSENNLIIDKVNTTIDSTNTLLITDDCRKQNQVMINFLYPEENKIEFEINKANILDANLSFDTELLLLGGTEIDLIELYKESQLLLNFVQEQLSSIENELRTKQREIDSSNNIIKDQKKEVKLQRNKFKKQTWEINNQLETIKEQEQKLSINKRELLEHQLDIEEKIKDLHKQEQEIEKSKEVLGNLNNEIISKQSQIDKQKREISKFLDTVEQQKRLIIITVTFLLVVLVLIFFIYRGFSIKKKIAIKLSEKEAETRRLFDLAPFAIIITSVASKKSLYMNQRGLELFKLPPNKASGEFSEKYYANPLQRTEVLNKIKEIGSVDNFEVLFTNSQDEPFYAWLSGIVTNYQNEEAFFIVLNDITERKKHLDEIKKKNFILRQQSEEIKTANIQLKKSEEELQKNNDELLSTHVKLATAKQKVEAAYEATKAQAALFTILDLANKDDSLEIMLQNIMDELLSIPWLEVQNKGAFLLPDKYNNAKIFVHKNIDDEILKLCQNVPSGYCLCGRAMESKELIFANNVNDSHEVKIRNIEDHGHYIVPVVFSNEVLGIICLYLNVNHERKEFEEKFLNSVAVTLANVLKRRQVQNDLIQNAKELQITNEHLIASEEELRQNSEELSTTNDKLALQKEELEIALENLQTTQTQLIQSEKMASLGQLTAGVAHELNNPINFVSGNVKPLQRDINELILVLNEYEKTVQSQNLESNFNKVIDLKKKLDFPLLKKEIENLLDGIEEGSIRSSQIIKDLRSFSRLDEDEFKKANIHDSIDSTLTLLKNKTKNRIEIIKQYGNLPNIDCLQSKLNQVFMNILSNSIHAIKDKGEITIKTGFSKKMISISIKDSGIGIPKEIANKIFEPFFTTKDIGKGTGLGLSITYGIIQKHNGNIKCNSSKKGTEFIITLPINQPLSK